MRAFDVGCGYCGASSEEGCMTLSGADAKKPHARRVFRQHEYEARHARVDAFFASTPEPEGTVEEIIDQARREQYERVMGVS